VYSRQKDEEARSRRYRQEEVEEESPVATAEKYLGPTAQLGDQASQAWKTEAQVTCTFYCHDLCCLN
jgi:hypothetical protein